MTRAPRSENILPHNGPDTISAYSTTVMSSRAGCIGANREETLTTKAPRQQIKGARGREPDLVARLDARAISSKGDDDHTNRGQSRGDDGQARYKRHADHGRAHLAEACRGRS